MQPILSYGECRTYDWVYFDSNVSPSRSYCGVQGVLNGLVAQGHGRDGIQQATMQPRLRSGRLSTLSTELRNTLSHHVHLSLIN